MRAARSAASIVRHAGGAATEALLVAALIGALAIAFGPVYAPASFLSGAGGAEAASGSSVWVTELAGLAPTSGLSYGAHFTVGYKTNTQQPWALARCYANSTTVLGGAPYADGSIWGEWFSVYPGGPSPQDFVLGASVSPVWTGGGADCTVGLYKLSGKYNGAQGFTNQTLLATYPFTANP
jgi:hypothetical protein